MKQVLEIQQDDATVKPIRFGPYTLELNIPKVKNIFADMAKALEIGQSFFFLDVKESGKLIRELVKLYGHGSFTAKSYLGDEQQPAGTRVWREKRTPRKRTAKPVPEPKAEENA